MGERLVTKQGQGIGELKGGGPEEKMKTPKKKNKRRGSKRGVAAATIRLCELPRKKVLSHPVWGKS